MCECLIKRNSDACGSKQSEFILKQYAIRFNNFMWLDWSHWPPLTQSKESFHCDYKIVFFLNNKYIMPEAVITRKRQEANQSNGSRSTGDGVKLSFRISQAIGNTFYRWWPLLFSINWFISGKWRRSIRCTVNLLTHLWLLFYSAWKWVSGLYFAVAGIEFMKATAALVYCFQINFIMQREFDVRLVKMDSLSVWAN